MFKFLLALFLLVPTVAFAKLDPFYKEAVMIGTIVQVDENVYCNTGVTVPVYYSLVWANNVNYYSGAVPVSAVGQTCINFIVIDKDAKNEVKALEGYLGSGVDATHDKRYKDAVGTIDPCPEGQDCSNTRPLWIFLEPGYQDAKLGD